MDKYQKTGWVQLNTRIPITLDQELALYYKTQRKTKQAIISEALTEYLNGNYALTPSLKRQLENYLIAANITRNVALNDAVQQYLDNKRSSINGR